MSSTGHSNSSPTSSSASLSTSLLYLVNAGDQAAWQRLWNVFQPLVQHWCLRVGLQNSDAEDVAQEVLRAVIRNIKDFDHRQQGASFRGWLWTITNSKIHDLWRKQKKNQPAVGGTDAIKVLQQVPDLNELSESGSLHVDDTKILVKSALELVRKEIQEKTWQAFWRTTVEEQPVSDVAQALQMTTGAVYVAKSRVIAKLRAELGELFDSEFKI